MNAMQQHRRTTLDRGAFFESEKLGPHQAYTPEGFLAINDVALCRTGILVYGPHEVPIDPGPDGLIRIHRDAQDVFHPDHIKSFLGKPIANDHPPEDVRPDNWRRYAVGTVLNPRRGEGADSDVLLADLIVHDPEAIEAIRSGKREVSCGYEADYEAVGPGEGRQVNLIANHLALVEAGRCGVRCAIGDRRNGHSPNGEIMSTKNWIDRVRVAFKAKDEAQLEQALALAPCDGSGGGGSGSVRSTRDDEGEGVGEEHTHIHVEGAAGGVGREEFMAHVAGNTSAIAALTARLDALEGSGNTEDAATVAAAAAARDAEAMSEKEKEEAAAKEAKAAADAAAAEAESEKEKEEEAPEAVKDQARQARDSAFFADSFQDTLAGAEILMPGIRVPTYDKAADPKVTLDAICTLRRDALRGAYLGAEMRPVIDALNGGKTLALDSMRCDAVRSLFRAAVTARRAANDAAVRRTTEEQTRGMPAKGPVRTLAELNARNRAYYADKR